MLDKIIKTIVDSGAHIAAVVIVIVLAFILYNVGKRSLSILEKKGKLTSPVVATLKMVMRWAIIVFTALLVLQQLGVLQNVWAAVLAIVAAIAVGFVANWSILSNTFSTLLVLVYRPFQIGDIIEIPSDNIKGKIIDINFMYLTLKMEGHKTVQIPNNTFFLKPVIRLEGEKAIPLHEQLKSETPYDDEQ